MKKTAKSKEKPRRGRKSEFTDDELKRQAVQVQNDLKGAQLTFLQLERSTGIGRNTWKRRIGDYIKELNRPVNRPFEITEGDEVYLPNLESIVDANWNKKDILINELYRFETMFHDLYDEVLELRQKIKMYDEKTKENNDLKIEIEKQKKRAAHYEQLYKQVTISSAYPHLRKHIDIDNKASLIEFKTDYKKNSDLKNLKNHFPNITPGNESEKLHKDSNDDFEKFIGEFPELLGSDDDS